MRKVLVVALLCLLPSVVGAQTGPAIWYYPPTSVVTSSGSSFFASGISLGNTSASPYANLYGDAANTLSLRNGGTSGVPVPQTFNIYNFCDGAACATGYERAAFLWSGNFLSVGTQNGGTGSARSMIINPIGSQIYLRPSNASGYILTSTAFNPENDDTRDLGNSTPFFFRGLYLNRFVQGSKSKTLTDNTATAFVRLSVADDDYEACAFGWTAYAEDAGTDARQVRKGRTNVAILNNSGTEACNFSASADDQAILVTGGTLTCSFDCNSASADTVDLRATCDTSLDATAETLTFEYRLDCESTVTVTPQ
jgi:hypothetical protein